MSLGQQVVTSLKQTAMFRVVGQIVAWLATIYVVRLLSPDDYGLIAMAMLPVSLLAILSDFGLSASVIRSPEISEPELRQVMGTIWLASCAACALTILLAPVLAYIYAEPRLTPALRVLSMQFLLCGLAALPEALLRRDMRFGAISLIDLFAACTGAASAVALAMSGAGFWTLVLAILIPSTIRTLSLNWLARISFTPAFSISLLAAHIRFGRNWAAATIIWTFYFTCDSTIVGAVLGTAIAGLYAVGKQIAILPTEKLMPFFNQIMFRAFASIQNDAERFAGQTARVMRLLTLFSVPVGWGFAAIANELVALLLGAKWVDAGPVVRVISLVIPLWMLGTLSSTIVQSRGHSSVALRGSLTALLIIPTGLLVAVKLIGFQGALVVWLVLHPLVILINLRREFRYIGLTFKTLFAEVWPALLAGLTMLATVTAAANLLPPELQLWARLPALIAVGALTYLPILYLLDRASIAEIRRLALR